MKTWNTKSIIPVFLEKVRYADGETQAFPLGRNIFLNRGSRYTGYIIFSIIF